MGAGSLQDHAPGMHLVAEEDNDDAHVASALALTALLGLLVQGFLFMGPLEVGISLVLALLVVGGLYTLTRSMAAAFAGGALAIALPATIPTLAGALLVSVMVVLSLFVRSPLVYGLGLLALIDPGPVGAAVAAVSMAALVGAASGLRHDPSGQGVGAVVIAVLLGLLSVLRHGQPMAVMGALVLGALVLYLRRHPGRARFSLLVGRLAPWMMIVPALAFALVAAVGRFPQGHAHTFLLTLGWVSVALGILMVPLTLGAEAFVASSDKRAAALMAAIGSIPVIAASALLAAGTAGAAAATAAVWPLVAWPAVLGLGRLRRLGGTSATAVAIAFALGVLVVGLLRRTVA